MERLPPPPLPGWLERLVPFERYRVKVDGLAMHVMEAGAGTPVLMVHGNPTWGFLWRKVAAELAGAPLRLILPDLPGLGFSDRPRRHSLEDHRRWMGGLVDALGLERLVLVVQDWGGPIGIAAMADRPERLAGLVVLNTVVGPPRQGFRPSLFHRFARMPVLSDVVLTGKPIALGMNLVQGDRGSIDRTATRAYAYALRPLDRAPVLLARMVPDSHEHPTIAGLERNRVFVETFDGPREIVWGERDPVLGRALSRVERMMHGARVTRTQAGHFLQEEVPAEIAAAIRRVAGAS